MHEKYVDQKGSTAMLAVKMLAGVALKVNLRNPLYAGNITHKYVIHPSLEAQGKCHQKSKIGLPVPTWKGLDFENLMLIHTAREQDYDKYKNGTRNNRS